MTTKRRRPRAVLLAAAPVIALSLAAPATTATATATPTATTTPAASHQITLLTGDRVLLDTRGDVTGLLHAEGREDIPARVVESESATYVIPLDAQPLIDDGTLDRRLFNVTELSREQYHAAANGLPVIVSYASANDEDAQRTRLYEAAGVAGPEETLASLNADSLTVTPGHAAAVWDALTAPTSRIASVALDGIVRTTLDQSVPQIGAPELWDAGYDGTGVTIAVVDTGISEEHPDLANGKVVAAASFGPTDYNGDLNGHGTHVASIAAGTGALSGGTYAGVAPGASLINAKVLDDQGFGEESDVIAGTEWAIERGADIVNMSLGGWPADTVSPLEQAVNILSAETDVLFVVAAGNGGPDPGTVTSPGSAEAALTVGAVDKQDTLAGFSSAGPLTRDGALKPDVTAPGVDIAAAAAPGSALEQNGEPAAEGYVYNQGTSMAAPHAAGAAALLAQAHPDWTGEELKGVLTGSTQPGAGYSAYQQGSGRIDVAAATGQTVIAEPASLSFGTAEWPNASPEPITRELTYRNLGTADVTLDLATTTLDPAGNPAPEGFFTLSADRVTVPAGGTATVSVTADASTAGLYGGYSLFVTASGEDGQTVRTAGAVEREAEAYDLTIEPTDRSGAPAADWSATVTNLETQEITMVSSDTSSGTSGTLRLPAGEYLVDVGVFTGDTGLDWLVRPHLALNADTTLAAPATAAREVSLTVDDEAAERTDITAGYTLQTADASFNAAWGGAGLTDGFRTAQLGEPGEGWDISGFASVTWEREGVEYHSADAQAGAFYTGITQHTESGQLALLTTHEGTSVPGQNGALFTRSSLVFYASEEEHALPRSTEVYVRAEPDAGEWSQEFWQTNAADHSISALYMSDPRAYEPGEASETVFNTGVFGPSIGPGDGLFRDGDMLYGRVNLLADGAGHSSFYGYDAASTTLYRNGEEYATAPVPLDELSFTVPPEEAAYELVTTASRGDPVSTVSTEITATYTFTSAAAPAEGEIARLPATAVRFTPALALDSTGPAGETVTVPVTVQGVEPASLVIEVSYDGGATWEDLPVTDGVAQVTNPPAGGTVSFRAEAEDAAGNATTQTIIDAYRTR
jgi:subtilisin family serine protease